MQVANGKPVITGFKGNEMKNLAMFGNSMEKISESYKTTLHVM